MNEFIIQWYSRSIFNFQPFEIKQLFRKIQTKSKQLITNNLHQEFNNICLNENLLPIYTNLFICIFKICIAFSLIYRNVAIKYKYSAIVSTLYTYYICIHLLFLI